jgi:hypothetical protein
MARRRSRTFAVLVEQAGRFGAVASESTCWRVLDAIGTQEARRHHRGLPLRQRASVPTFKHTVGYRPMVTLLNNTGRR